MTGEELERAIEFLLQSQAVFEASLEQTRQENEVRFAHFDKLIETLAESQNELTQVVTRHVESQVEINSSFREGDKSLRAAVRENDESWRAAMREREESSRAAMREGDESLRVRLDDLAAAQVRTEETVNHLAATVDRYFAGRNTGRS